MLKLTGLIASALIVTGCGGSGGGAPASNTVPLNLPEVASFSIGGSVRGLAANTSVILTNGAAATLTVTADGDFTFPAKAVAGTAYAVTIGVNPAGLVCTATGATGVVAAADIHSVAVVCSPVSSTVVQSGMAVSTIAGYTGSQGEGDGSRIDATFACPFGIAVDDAANLYVTDAQGKSVRRIAASGVVSTLASDFDAPGGIARDSAGTLYVADTSADALRSITLAGGATLSDLGLVWNNAMPVGVALDAAGNVYTVARGKSVILKLRPAGALTTLAGQAYAAGTADGAGPDARFNLPFGVASDANGNLFISDRGNHTIRRITAAGLVSTIAGAAGVAGSADGTGAAARFNQPAGLTLDGAGNLYIVDNGNRTVRKMTPAGSVTTIAGVAGATGSADGDGAVATFKDPYGVAADGAGNLYVTDCGNATIRKLAPNSAGTTVTITPPVTVSAETATVTTLAGKSGEAGQVNGTGSDARFSSSFAIVVDGAGNIFVADGGQSNLLRKITPGGVVTTFAGSAGATHDGVGTQAAFEPFFGLAIDGFGNLYTPGHGYDAGTAVGLRKVTPAGVVTTIAVPIYGGTTLHALGGDASGNVYAIDGDRIDKITFAPVTATVLAGALSSFMPLYHFDGAGAAARFSGPTGVAVDSAGNVFVADTANLVIRKITPGGVTSTFAGRVGQVGTAPGYDSANVDGTRDAARFFYPQGLAIDGADNLYVFDNFTIRKITPQGVVTTIAGLANASGAADGVGVAARFGNVGGIAVDRAGTIYVTDSQTVRKIVQH